MDNSSTTTGTLDQTDEDIRTYTVSDEALEAVAVSERGAPSFFGSHTRFFAAADSLG